MILASPTEDYNAELAYKVLQSFSENELVLGLEILKENGTISKQQKIGPEVRFVPGLPNRGICLNDKFLSFFGRYLPDNFFKHAIAYREKILVQGDMTIPEGNSAGMFAAMYDMVIDGDVALTAVIPTVEYSIEEKDSCKYYLILAKNISLQLAANQVNPSPAPKRREIDSSYLSPSLKKRFSTKEKGKGPATASDRHIQQISSLSNHNFDFVSALYGKISDAESLGISYKDLADDVSVSLDALDVCLKQMIVAKLIEEVGFTHPRYIACVYLEEWKVSILSPNSGSVISFIPCVYSQFDGTLNYKLYRGCCQSLLGIIAQKPGVSFSGIYKRSKSVLNQMELRQLLEDLIGKGFISKTIAPIKVTEGPFDDLFEDPEVSHSSCYFPSKNFYQF